jgi:hypothetical protein
VHVYHGVDAGKPVYAGITNDIARRQLQHGERFVLEQLTPAAGVTRGQVRAIEEALIVRNPGFQTRGTRSARATPGIRTRSTGAATG